MLQLIDLISTLQKRKLISKQKEETVIDTISGLSLRAVTKNEDRIAKKRFNRYLGRRNLQ